MSKSQTVVRDTLEQAAAAARKPWRAPEVIQAEQCPQAAKTHPGAVEHHSTTSTNVSS